MKPLLCLLLSAAATYAQQPSALDLLLSHLVLDPQQAQVEQQAYTASRVPLLPTFTSAADWTRYADRLRADILSKVVLRGAVAEWAKAPLKVEWADTIQGDGYKVKKLRFEVAPGFWLPALLYEPDQITAKTPVVLNVNGHEGVGVATSYIQQRCINLAKRGIIALNPEWIGMGQMKSDADQSHYKLNQLDLCGTSGVGVFYLSLTRSLDLLLQRPNADPSRVAVTGLSGGGWQTIFLSSLDTRVKVAMPVAGYSSFVTRSQWPDLDLGDSEQTPQDLASIADYTHLTALMAPRAIQITHNAKDNCCFRADYAPGPLLQASRQVYPLLGAANKLRYHFNYSNGHNYDKDNREALYRLLRDEFYPGSTTFPLAEIPSESEVRTVEQLKVAMPVEQGNLHTLAMRVCASLPQQKRPPTEQAIRHFLKSPTYRAEAVPMGSDEQDGVKAKYWKLQLGNEWTLAATELEGPQPRQTVLLTGDAGKAKQSLLVRKLLDDGNRVVLLDTLGMGEANGGKRDFLFQVLISGLGERPLAINAAQINAVARWLIEDRKFPTRLITEGPRMGVVGLVALATNRNLIQEIEMHNGLGSLHQVIENNWTVEKYPEQFAFGLLQQFDLRQLVAALPKHKITWVEPDTRVKDEMKGLAVTFK